MMVVFDGSTDGTDESAQSARAVPASRLRSDVMRAQHRFQVRSGKKRASRDSMRILHLIHSGGVYGAEYILLYLAREQQQRSHSSLIGSIGDIGMPQTPLEAIARSWGLPVVPIRVAPRRPTPGVVRSLLRTVQALGPDVLHSHGYKANILLGPVPWRWRGPMVATLHGWTSWRCGGWIRWSSSHVTC